MIRKLFHTYTLTTHVRFIRWLIDVWLRATARHMFPHTHTQPLSDTKHVHLKLEAPKLARDYLFFFLISTFFVRFYYRSCKRPGDLFFLCILYQIKTHGILKATVYMFFFVFVVKFEFFMKHT